MTTNTEHPFTAAELNELTAEQREVIEAVAEYLCGNPKLDGQPDEDITSAFNLLKPCDGCVPFEEAGEDLLKSIRKKFGAVYQLGMELAEAELKQKNHSDFSFCFIVEPSREDSTHVAIVDYNHGICYLHDYMKAWHLNFNSLAELADSVLEVKHRIIEKITNPIEIFILVEGGVVHEVVNLPTTINVTVIDYDTEGVEKERLKISPIDGELCVINKW